MQYSRLHSLVPNTVSLQSKDIFTFQCAARVMDLYARVHLNCHKYGRMALKSWLWKTEDCLNIFYAVGVSQISCLLDMISDIGLTFN